MTFSYQTDRDDSRSLGDRLASLEAAADIENVLIEYFDSVDAKDAEGAASLFTEDAELEILTGKTYSGRASISRALTRVLEQYGKTSHQMMNHRSWNDQSSAVAYTYLYAFHRMAESSEIWHFWGRIEDELLLLDGRWRIHRHRLRGLDWEPSRADMPSNWLSSHPGARRAFKGQFD